MIELRIEPYAPADSEAACALERACVQGGALAVRFNRPTFHARAGVYEDASILCGWDHDRLVGTVAAARKQVRLHERDLTAMYFFDLRIHPTFRGQGLSHRLIQAALEQSGPDVECHYILVAGQNERMLRLIREHYRSDVEVTLPLTYVCLPVFRQRPDVQVIPASAEDVRARYLETVRPTLVPIFRPAYYTGWVESLSVDGAGCSIWTNERLLAEEVVRLPLPLRMLRAVQGPLSPLVALPRVPDTGEQIRSLFLYDLYADTPRALGHLLDAVNAMARARGALVLYLLMQPHDPHLTWVRARHRVRFQFPYRLLARGKDVPGPDDRVYIDIRDL